MQRVNEKPQVVNDYESGRAIPNQQIISKLERAVDVEAKRERHWSTAGLQEEMTRLINHVAIQLIFTCLLKYFCCAILVSVCTYFGTIS